MLVLEVADRGLDCGAASHLAFDLRGETALLLGRVDPELVIGRAPRWAKRFSSRAHPAQQSIGERRRMACLSNSRSLSRDQPSAVLNAMTRTGVS